MLLNSDGETASLTPRVFDTLLYLVRNKGKVLTKDELLNAVWTDTIVEENNLNQHISLLRKVFGASRGDNRYIVTIPGRGYKFVAEVGEISAEEIQEEEGDATENLQMPEILTVPAELNSSKLQTVNSNFRREDKAFSETKRFWLYAVAIALIITLSSLGFYSWRGNTTPDEPIKTVTV